MQDVALAAAGIVVTVLTFYIGYRQTIGVRQERIRTLDDVIVDTLLKRLVLEQAELRWSDLQRVVTGKASGAKVPVSALRQPDAIGNVLYSRIVETDLIGKEDRERALAALIRLDLDTPEAEQKSQLLADARARGRRRAYTGYVVLLGLVTSLLGALVVGLLGGDDGRENPTALILQFGVGLVLVSFIGLASLLRTAGPLWRVSAVRESGANPILREFATYPSEEQGTAALERLDTLSPFAVRNLFQLAEDERRSLWLGYPPGMTGDINITLGLAELLENGYVEAVEMPKGSRKRHPSHDTWYGLTPQGRALARLLLPSLADVPPPEYLMGFASQGATSVVNEGSTAEP